MSAETPAPTPVAPPMFSSEVPISGSPASSASIPNTQVDDEVERRPVAALLGESVVAPLRGRALSWLVLFGAVIGLGVVLGDHIGLALKLAFIGLIPAYAAVTFRSGLGQQPIPLVQIQDWAKELVLPGLAMLALVIVLMGVPFTVLGSLAEEAKAEERTRISAKLTELEDRQRNRRSEYSNVEYFDGGETFKLPDGSVGQVTGSQPVVAQRIGGGYVKVYPDQGYLKVMAPGYKPGDPEPVSDEGDYEKQERLEKQKEALEDLGRFETLAQLPTPASFNWAFLALALVVAVAFWPGALVAPVLSGDVIEVFNPLAVGRLARGGGGAYAIIAVVGAALGLGPALLCGAAGLDPSGLLMVLFLGPGNTAIRLGLDVSSDGIVLSLVLMSCVAYASAVQTYFLGRLVGTRPEVWADQRS